MAFRAGGAQLATGSTDRTIVVWDVASAARVRALEDRTLRNELDGYEDYTRRVRFRLIPGAW